MHLLRAASGRSQAVLCIPRQTSRVAEKWPRCSNFENSIRYLHSIRPPHSRSHDLAFVFDIDGVLVRGHKPLPKVAGTLSSLKKHRIPFILLTNGGGYHEKERAVRLSEELGVSIDVDMIVQSHTPFQDMDEYKSGTALISGGEHDNCRQVAQSYGFKNVISTSDMYAQHPELWPFSKFFLPYHSKDSKSLPRPVLAGESEQALKVDSIFVYNDPRDWGLDLAIIVDCLLSKDGQIGTISPKNGNEKLPNRGYQQDGQPDLFFSNPDLWFAAEFALPRLGQGGFRAALEGVWADITGGPSAGVELQMRTFGKPHQETYDYAEKKLEARRASLLGEDATRSPLKQVVMVGDNPESDIRGASSFRSNRGIKWMSALVKSGIYTGGEPACQPSAIVKDVSEAVQWGIQQSRLP